MQTETERREAADLFVRALDGKLDGAEEDAAELPGGAAGCNCFETGELVSTHGRGDAGL